MNKSFSKWISLIFAFLVIEMYPQDIKVYEVLGKNPLEVIQKYGDPVYLDSTVAEAICLFYKYPTGSMIFVADSAGVYQAESVIEFKIKREARSEIDKFLKKSSSEKFTVDEQDEENVQLRKAGVRLEIALLEDKAQRKYEIKVKANKSEY